MEVLSTIGYLPFYSFLGTSPTYLGMGLLFCYTVSVRRDLLAVSPLRRVGSTLLHTFLCCLWNDGWALLLLVLPYNLYLQAPCFTPSHSRLASPFTTRKHPSSMAQVGVLLLLEHVCFDLVVLLPCTLKCFDSRAFCKVFSAFVITFN